MGVAMRERRMRGLASDPQLAALEVLLFPDRNDLLDAIDREPTRLEGFAAMGRRDRDCDRGLTDIDAADTMGNCDTHDRETFACGARNLAHLAERHRLVGFVLEPRHAASGIIDPRSAGEGRRRSGARIGDRALQLLEIDFPGDNLHRSEPGRLAAAADRRDECNLVAAARPVVAIDVLVIHRESDAVMMTGELREFRQQALPYFIDRDAVGKLAIDFPGARPLAERGEQFYRDPVHRPRRCAIWPSSGNSSFSRPSRHAAGDPGKATTILPRITPASARLRNAAGPISLYESIRNSSPKPSSSLSIMRRATSIVESRGAIPVPPLSISASTCGIPAAIACSIKPGVSGAIS